LDFVSIDSPPFVFYDIGTKSTLSTYRYKEEKGKENPMSAFVVAVVLILTVLFIVISVVPLLPEQKDVDSSHHSPSPKTKVVH
jgi:hypothetical protein